MFGLVNIQLVDILCLSQLEYTIKVNTHSLRIAMIGLFITLTEIILFLLKQGKLQWAHVSTKLCLFVCLQLKTYTLNLFANELRVFWC